MEPLKEMFNAKFYTHFAQVFSETDKAFNEQQFIKEAVTGLEELSLNTRLRKTTELLRKYLPADYRKAVNTIYKAAPKLKRGYTSLVMPDFVGLYGIEDVDFSLDALKYFTQFGSSEFAIRVFIKQHLNKTIKVMEGWAKDKEVHVRRLSSEGSRPRLPWSFKLDAVVKDPSITKKILHQLKEDEELYVKKSVANHLNDITKEHPAYMISLVESWDKQNPHTAWIVKHGSRTLIKNGDPASLKLFDFESDVNVELKSFKLKSKELVLGDYLSFEFDIKSLKDSSQKLVVDYALHYLKSRGQHNRKVFKLKEVLLAGNGMVHVEKKQIIKDFSTRKHNEGLHYLEIMINGKTFKKVKFHIYK